MAKITLGPDFGILNDNISPAVSPYLSRAEKAIDFYNKNWDNSGTTKMMLALGKGPKKLLPNGTYVEGWPTNSEGIEIPPLPSLAATQLIDVIGFKPISEVSFVYSETAGNILVGGTLWRKIINNDPSLVRELRSRWLFVRAILNGAADFTGEIYRQVGLYSQVKLKTGIDPNKKFYLPTDVETEADGSVKGILEVYQNVPPTERKAAIVETFSWVLEF